MYHRDDSGDDQTVCGRSQQPPGWTRWYFFGGVFFSHHDALQDERPAGPLKVSSLLVCGDPSTPQSVAKLTKYT